MTSTTLPYTGWSEQVLAFWFGELTRKDWFTVNPQIDADIRRRFGSILDDLGQQPLRPEFETTPRAALAGVIVLDQFSRNIHRGTPLAFATDPQALGLAGRSVDKGFDRDLSVDERCFLYLPFEDSEDRVVQARSIALFTALGDANALDFAHRHKAIIDRFGRYPHRNAILRRTSTPEELAFLEQPGSGF